MDMVIEWQFAQAAVLGGDPCARDCQFAHAVVLGGDSCAGDGAGSKAGKEDMDMVIESQFAQTVVLGGDSCAGDGAGSKAKNKAGRG